MIFTKRYDWNVNIYFLGGRYGLDADGLSIGDVTKDDEGTYTCGAQQTEYGTIETLEIEVTVDENRTSMYRFQCYCV